jgi:hypothetical protein
MRHNTSVQVFNYFNALRADRAAPMRNEIDPAALKSVLPDVFILEKKRDGVVRFRLAGTRICLILGRELREHAFADIWDETVCHRMRLAADAVLANRRAVEIAVTAYDEEGNATPLELLMLPLFSNEGRCDRIFGSLAVMQNRLPAEGHARYLKPADITFMPADDDTAPRPVSDIHHTVAAVGISANTNRATYLRLLEGGRRD